MPDNISFMILSLKSWLLSFLAYKTLLLLAVYMFNGIKKTVVANPTNAAMPKYRHNINMQIMICNGEDQIIFKKGVKFWNIWASCDIRLFISPIVDDRFEVADKSKLFL